MTNRYTTGPWTVLFGGHGTDGYFVIASRGGDTLICDSSPRQELPPEELNANARLIAAAPELLDALADMLAGWRYIREQYGDLYGAGWDRAQQKAETALAKVRGEHR